MDAFEKWCEKYVIHKQDMTVTIFNFKCTFYSLANAIRYPQANLYTVYCLVYCNLQHDGSAYIGWNIWVKLAVACLIKICSLICILLSHSRRLCVLSNKYALELVRAYTFWTRPTITCIKRFPYSTIRWSFHVLVLWLCCTMYTITFEYPYTHDRFKYFTMVSTNITAFAFAHICYYVCRKL